MDEFRKDLEDYFCRFTFGQFVTLILLEIVTLFFVFYLGARYGTDLIGSKSRNAARDETAFPRETPNSVDDIVGKSPVDFTYPEVLTGPSGSTASPNSEARKAIRVKPSGVTAEEYAKKNPPPPPNPTVFEPPPEVPAEPLPASGGEVAEPIQEAPAKAPEKPVAGESVKSHGKFSVQVGSYQSPDEAQVQVGKWKKKGYSSFASVGEVPQKGIWHRVRIGTFPSRQDAQKFLESFQKREKIKGLVVSVSKDES